MAGGNGVALGAKRDNFVEKGKEQFPFLNYTLHLPCMKTNKNAWIKMKVVIKNDLCKINPGRGSLNHANNCNLTEKRATWSEMILVISKSNEHAARVRIEITTMILDQDCMRTSYTTLLDLF